MIVQTIKVDEVTFNKIKEDCYRIKNLDPASFTEILTKGRKGMDKKTALYDEVNVSLICRKLDLLYEIASAKEISDCEDSWKDVCLTIDYSATKVMETTEDVYIRPYATACNKYMNTLLLNYYTKDEIEEIYATHKFKPQSNEDTEIHSWIPVKYKPGIIYKLDNCVKYDINSAYLYQLSLLFPKAKDGFVSIRRRINKFKAAGEKNKARELKDIVNFFIGDMVNNGHTETRAYIVHEIRLMMNEAIANIGGELLYANTDGFIAHNPDKVFNCSSKRLGEFKSELYEEFGSVWIYLHRGTYHNYQIYQYRDVNNEIDQVGTVPLSMRLNINLEEGQVIDYAETKVGNKKEYELKEIYNEKVQIEED